MDPVSKYFLLFLLSVALGFALLIHFLLKSRKQFQADNLKLPANDIWKFIEKRASKSGFSRAHLIFGIYKDVTSTTMGLIVKDEHDQIIGRVEKTTGERQARIFAGEDLFLVEYPLSYWNRTLELYSPDGQTLLAKCIEKTFPIGKLHYEFPNRPSLISFRNYWNWQYQDNLHSEGRLMGTVQSIPPGTTIKGRMGVLPPELSLAIRIFILAHPLL